jgi:hypothetical protein
MLSLNIKIYVYVHVCMWTYLYVDIRTFIHAYICLPVPLPQSKILTTSMLRLLVPEILPISFELFHKMLLTAKKDHRHFPSWFIFCDVNKRLYSCLYSWFIWHIYMKFLIFFHNFSCHYESVIKTQDEVNINLSYFFIARALQNVCLSQTWIILRNWVILT